MGNSPDKEAAVAVITTAQTEKKAIPEGFGRLYSGKLNTLFLNIISLSKVLPVFFHNGEKTDTIS